MLWAGTDDGRVHLSRNGGRDWTDLSANVPGVAGERHVSRVIASYFAEGTAYLALDRHRNDDRRPYLFRTTDYGATWKPLANDLPESGPVYVVRESSRNPDLLFAGTEFGLFVSLDGGAHWQRYTRAADGARSTTWSSTRATANWSSARTAAASTSWTWRRWRR